MRRPAILILLLASCRIAPAERYGFVALLGRDTVSVESVSRHGNTITSNEVDRFPRVRQRYTEIELADDGSIRKLAMDIHTPSEPENERDRRIEAEVRGDSVYLTKRDGSGTKRYTFGTSGKMAVAHVPQMYSLYEVYFAAALRQAESAGLGNGERVEMRQFYIDREFDRFPLHKGFVRKSGNGKAEIRHDWLAGAGEATLDSSHRLLAYSGARTTYRVDVKRLDTQPDIDAIAKSFAAGESRRGMKQLSVRDTVTAAIGRASLTVDYSRPLARGRVLLGDVIPYGLVWRTGANAATQLTTSAPITISGVSLDPGTYTLWTLPRPAGVELIVNSQTGQWGTGYNPAHDIGRVTMSAAVAASPVDTFTISVKPLDAARAELTMEWGSFRWTAPVVVQSDNSTIKGK